MFGVQAETVRSWISRGCPAAVGSSPDGGRYDIAQMIRWCRKHVWVPRQNGSGGSGSTESELKIKILEIEYTTRALALKERLGQLVKKEAVLAAQTQQNVKIKTRLEAIPGEVAANIPVSLRSETIQAWERAIHRILKEMANYEHE